MKRFAALLFCSQLLSAQNQTDTISPILPEDESLPFTISVELAPFTLPTGIQSYAGGILNGKWLLLAGRTNGLHGFDFVGNNFPPSQQNTVVYLFDPWTGNSWSRSLYDATSGLNQTEIDILSATATESFQKGDLLYVVGGYGINTLTQEMETKSTLTEINMNKMSEWVMRGTPSAKSAIRQVSDPFLQVTGGALYQTDPHSPMLLMLGQNFQGLYHDNSNGQYTMQIRPFWLNNDGEKLRIIPGRSKDVFPDYRRRDLNVVPIYFRNQPAYVALSGVFTIDGGIWTVPITILPDGSSHEPDPTLPTTFKQGMNNYFCPFIGLYSTSRQTMFSILPGGLSYGFFSNGTFETDPEIPFINQITTIRIDKNNRYTQFLMDAEYPFIASTGSNPGNQLLFGASAQFFEAEGIETYYNGVIQLDQIQRPTNLGFIVGGIMSTLPNTNTMSDSTASPYIFKVVLTPK